jgi:hypothetical protein
MATQAIKKVQLREKVRHELIEYGINIIYLTLVFAAFTQYRRFLLAAYDISYTNYWVALIEAVVLGKVIMIGSVFRLGRGLESKPLIFPTLYKTMVFIVFCAAFKVLEHGIRGLVKGEGFVGGIVELSHKGADELLANSLVVFVALVPFFAVKELGRVLGEQKISDLFFRRSAHP